MWSSSTKTPSFHRGEWCTWHARVMTGYQQHKVHSPQTAKGLTVILSMASFRQHCSPLPAMNHAIPAAAMKCLWGRTTWLLDASYRISAFKWVAQIHSSPCCSTLWGTEMNLHLTLSLDKNPEQWMSTWNSLEEVVIIINREKVSMHISISDHHFQVGYVMDVKN